MKFKTVSFLSSILFSFLVFGLFLVSSVSAGTSATVTATVTAQNISLTVAPGTVTYGTLALNSSKSTIATDLNATQTVMNNGNIAEDITIAGSSSANWTLAATAGANQFVHQFCTASCSAPPTNFTALTTSFQALATNVAANGTQPVDLRLTTPTSTTFFTSQSVGVTIQAAAH